MKYEFGENEIDEKQSFTQYGHIICRCLRCFAPIRARQEYEIFISDEGPGDVTEYRICMSCVRSKKIEQILK